MANYTISSGVISRGVILNENDFMNVLYRGKASNTTVNSGGTMQIQSNGVATTTTVNSGGSMELFPGGNANSTTVNSGGLVIGYNDGYANKTEINSGGQFNLGDGTSANSATVHNGGKLYLSDGGKLSGMMVFEAGAVVSAALNAILDFDIHVFNNPNGVTSYILLNDFSLIQGSPTYTLTVGGNDPGIYRLAGNAAGFNDRTITVKNSSGDEFGTFKVGGEKIVGDKKYNLSINTSSELVVTVTNLYDLTGYLTGKANLSSGMIASGVLINSGGILNVLNGGYASMTRITDGSMYVSDGGSASMTSIESKGLMHVSSGGTADGVNVYYGANLHISDGGKADGVSITGELNVSAGGTVNTTTVKEAGRMYVSDGGRADDVTVDSRGYLCVSSGGTAMYVRENGGYVYEDNEATVLFLPNEFGGYTYTFGSATIHSGTIGNNLSAVYIGKIDVCFSGIARNTTVGSKGALQVYNGGRADTTTVSSGGSMTVYEGGKITGKMNFDDNAVVSAYEGGIVDFDLRQTNAGSGAVEALVNHLSLVQGAPTYTLTVDGTQTNGDYKLAEGAAGFDKTITVVNAYGRALGTLTLDGGTTPIDGRNYTLTLTDGGALGVTLADGDTTPPVVFVEVDPSTGPAQDVTVSAEFSDNVALKSTLYRINDGPWQDYTCEMAILENLTISFKAIDTSGNESDVVTIVINNIDTEEPTITNITPSTTKPAASVTVTATFSDNVEIATKRYRIGSGDWQDYPDGGVTVTENTGVFFRATDTAGNVTDAVYEVTNIVSAPAGPAKSDIDGNGVSDVMFVWTGEHGEGNYQHGYWMNGTNEWRSANSSHPAEWDNLGCYDMTGDGKADSVLFGNVTSEAGVKGAYIGYYADAIDLPDGSTWVNIGFLNNENNIVWKNKVGNLTGGTANSIVWYAPDLYALGAWTDGTETWVTLSNTFGGSAWTLVGCGDFTGDGKDQVVMALNGGELYYAVGIDGASSELTKSDSGWEIRAIGDFSGDGKDDIVAFHKETGLVAMWGDGDAANKWSKLGQLDANDWFVVGCGDYDADAKDDLLVRQYSTGMLGYYSSGDMAQWVELGRGVDMNWMVIA